MKVEIIMEITLYSSLNEAMDCGWESMYFPGNHTHFALMEQGKRKLVLTTAGMVRVLDKKTGITESCDRVKTAVVKEIVESEYVSERYEVLSNNWFSVQFYEGSVMVDDLVLESTPKSIEELVQFLEDFWRYFTLLAA